MGRPLPGDRLPASDAAVEETLRRVRNNPYAQGIGLDEHHVQSVLEENYLGIEPWPFGSLTLP
jgi:hypothetical protein